MEVCSAVFIFAATECCVRAFARFANHFYRYHQDCCTPFMMLQSVPDSTEYNHNNVILQLETFVKDALRRNNITNSDPFHVHLETLDKW